VKGQRNLWRIGLILLLIGVGPLAFAIATQLLANALGCSVNEGGAVPCLVGGIDIGEGLYFGFVGFILFFLTAPVAVAGAVTLAIAAIRALVARVRGG
jgi:hypothetical protein